METFGNFIIELASGYRSIFDGGGTIIDALDELLGPMGYTVTKNVPCTTSATETNPLFSTFITSEEMLDWTICETVRAALIEEAFSQWFTQDRETAEFYEDCWVGFVHVKPSGGYNVWIEADTGHTPSHKINMSVDAVRRCRDLMAELQSTSRQITDLRVSDLHLMPGLDEQYSVTVDDLADEMISLLVINHLVGPPVKVDSDGQ